ncbi:unnamed protein product, partial [Mesorhabditis spiculigera]
MLHYRLCAAFLFLSLASVAEGLNTTEAIRIFASPLTVGDEIEVRTITLRGWESWTCLLENTARDIVFLNATHLEKADFYGSMRYSSRSRDQLSVEVKDWIFHKQPQVLHFRIRVFTAKSLLITYGYIGAAVSKSIARYYEVPAGMTDVLLEAVQQIRCHGHIYDTTFRQTTIFGQR